MRNRVLPLGLLALAGAAACSGKARTTDIPAALAIAPASIDFKTVEVATTKQAQITFEAQTVSAVELSKLSISDPGDGSASAFSVQSPPAEVPGNSTVAVTVTFAPTEVRTYSATLTVQSNDASQPTQSVALTGKGGERAISISLENPTGATATLDQDGGLGIAFAAPYGGASGIAWPQVLISNTGAIAANLTGFHFTHGDAGFFLPSVPTVPQSIAPEQARTLEVSFAPPSGNTASALSDALTLEFDDPKLPSARISLSAQVAVDEPPVACAHIESSQELDGTVQRAADGQVAVEPGARVQLTAFADDIGDAGSPACTYDPEDGRTGLTYAWAVTNAPVGSRATLAAPNDPRPTFIPDLAGWYTIGLTVTDSQGASKNAEVDFAAAPLEDLTAILLWPGQPQVDLDLHFVRPGGRPFSAADDVSSLTGDGGHDWGTQSDPTDDPHFSGDDQGDGNLVESAWLNHPEDGCLSDGGCSYGVWVHYFQDRRAVDGGSCGQTTCFEGTGCGCSGDRVCEPGPTGASCAEPVAPQVQIFLKGQTGPAIQIPVDPLLLPSPCFTWHALEVKWSTDGGAPAFSQPGDGGEVEYWGAQTNSIRECVAGAGGYSPTSPPLLQP